MKNSARKCRISKLGAKKQHGAVLVVALIILTALTLVGVSSMQSTTLEMRMASSSIERSRSFNETEAAIAQAVRWLDQNVRSYADLHNDTGLFSADCTSGLCFQGDYSVDMAYTYECRLDQEVSEPNWTVKENDVWSSANRHIQSTLNENLKYIIEFKCFVGRDRNAPYGPQLGGSDEADPLFVITAYLDSDSGKPPVMIQVSHTVRI